MAATIGRKHVNHSPNYRPLKINEHYADILSLRRFVSITQDCKDNAGLMALRSAGSLRPPSASCCGRPTAQQTHASPAGSGSGGSEAPPPAATSSCCYAVGGRLGSRDLQAMPSEGQLALQSSSAASIIAGARHYQRWLLVSVDVVARAGYLL